MEWAKDGETGELFIVQARPGDGAVAQGGERVQVLPDQVEGPQAGHRASASATRSSTGPVCLIDSPRDIDRFVDGAILVTQHDRPGLGADHEARRGDRHRPRRAAPRTPPSSAASSACRPSSAPATRPQVLHDEQEVTVSCAEGDEGFVYEGIAEFEVEEARPRAASRRRAPRSCSTSPIRPRPSAGGACRPTASGLRAWNSSSATTSRSIRWRWCTSTR